MIFAGEDVWIKGDLLAIDSYHPLLFDVIGDRFAEGGDPVVRIDDVESGVDAESRFFDGT